MSGTVHLACLQTAPRPDFAAAIDEAIPLAERAVSDGAKLLALPEFCGGLASQGRTLVPPAAPEAEHPVLEALREFAARRGVWILVGSVAVPDDRSVETNRFRNRSVLLDDTGCIVCRYDKIHLFDLRVSSSVEFRESDSVSPGSSACLVDTPFATLGLSICYDLRFPKLYRDLAQAGAEVLMVPAAFTRQTGEMHWHILNRARAIENTAFVVAPGARGRVSGGGETYGHSLIIDPLGKILADAGDRPGVVQACIDIDQVYATRQRIQSLVHDRPYELLRSGVAAEA